MKRKFWVIPLGIAFLATGCVSDYSFNNPASGSGNSLNGKGGTNPGGGYPGCTAGTTTIPLKIMFMADASGSTQTTDPNCKERCASISTFINDYGSNTKLSYNFSYFSSAPVEWDMNQLRFLSAGSTTSDPFGNVSGLSSALKSFSSHAGSGSTGYAQAFSALQTLIANDEKAGSTENYSVLFMSDGMPTDLLCDDGSNPTSAGCVATNSIKTLVENLLQAVAANGVSKATVSAIYFGPDDANAVSNLKAMAADGGGQFVDTNQTTDIVINDIITVPGQCS